MDNSMDSLVNEDEATKLVRQLKELWADKFKGFDRNRFEGQSKQIYLSMTCLQ